MAWRWPAALLLHVNLLLAVLAGAGLATAARLKWDPTAYVPLRQLLPSEYRVCAGALCAAAGALLALVHLAGAALQARGRARRRLLLGYAALLAALACAQAAWLAWSGARVAAWLHSEQAARLLELAELREHVEPLLALLSRWHPLPERVRELLAEARADAPRNMYVAAAALAAAALLQPAAVLLALLAAAAARPAAVPRRSLTELSTASSGEQAPLKTAFRNGRLVVV